jgi:hypothetical protein
MRGNSQVASARLRADTPTGRWSAWLASTRAEWRRARLERLEIIERLEAETRRARQSGKCTPKLRPWL